MTRRVSIFEFRFLIAGGLVALALGACASPWATRGRAGDSVVLDGTPFPETFDGPPTYGENPSTDRHETAWILRLHRPLTFKTSAGETTVVQEVQLIGFEAPATTAHFQGILDEAVSGHHRRPVLLTRR